MDYRPLGRTGVMVSPLCIGTFNFSDPTPEDESQRIIERALDAGINFFDTADSYHAGESERLLGRSLAKLDARHNALIITKSYFPTGPGPNERGNSRLHILRACEASLKRLGTDYIDVFLLHRPAFDIPQEESLGALLEGRRRHEQVEHGLVNRALETVLDETLAECARQGVVVLKAGTYDNVVRFLPPLTIAEELLGEGLDVMEKALAELEASTG